MHVLKKETVSEVQNDTSTESTESTSGCLVSRETIVLEFATAAGKL